MNAKTAKKLRRAATDAILADSPEKTDEAMTSLYAAPEKGVNRALRMAERKIRKSGLLPPGLFAPAPSETVGSPL